jgi:hypothetical protein
MKRSLFVLAAAAAIVAGSVLAAQKEPVLTPAGRQGGPPQPMGFFITSVGLGNGANLGGLQGADAHCQKLAEASGQTGAEKRVWRAYLSTQGDKAVNARDRIGQGPWANAKGQVVARDLAHLHGDTLELAQQGNNINKVTAISEKGTAINGVGDQPNQHDILTGSTPAGRAFPAGEDRTCNNWTSSATGSAMLGHHDRTGGASVSWNSVHPSKGCSQENLVGTGGSGYLYCFAEK